MPLRAVAQKAMASGSEEELLRATSANGGGIALRSLLVCNRNAASRTFRMRLAIGNEAVSDKQYLFYNSFLPPLYSFPVTLDIGLQPGDVIYTYASDTDVSITLFGE